MIETQGGKEGRKEEREEGRSKLDVSQVLKGNMKERDGRGEMGIEMDKKHSFQEDQNHHLLSLSFHHCNLSLISDSISGGIVVRLLFNKILSIK